MQLALYGKSLELTPSLRGHVQQRLDKLDRLFAGTVPTAQVVLSVQRDLQSVEVTIPFEGFLVRAEDSEASMYAAVDLVLEKLERQIEKYRTRLNRKHRHGGLRRADTGAVPDAVADGPDDTAEEGEVLVRTKLFPLKPMTLEEAVLQMNLLGHDFFVFRESASEEVQVVYRRRHGGYGLIVGQ